MNAEDRTAVMALLRTSAALDGHIDALSKILCAQMSDPGVRFPGLTVLDKQFGTEVVRFKVHTKQVVALYSQILGADGLVAQVSFCTVMLNGAIGDGIFTLTVDRNGFIPIENNEAIELDGVSDSFHDGVRRMIFFRVLHLLQKSLPNGA